MAKKYLTLQEAAERLGITPEELEREREGGVIRGFANRGSWKFREEDIEEFARTRETDSAPDIPLAASESGDEDTIMDLLGETDSDSDVQLFSDSSLFDEDDEFPDLTASDSDVRLAGDSGPMLESEDSTPSGQSVLDFDSDSDEALHGSDSDVNLVGAGTDPDINLAEVPPGESSPVAATDADIDLNSGLFDDDDDLNFDDSDSDVKLATLGFDESDVSLVDSDSDVKVAVTDPTDSDSDIILSDSDSDVHVAADDSDNDSDIILSDSDSDVRLAADDDEPSDSDSDINLTDGLDQDSAVDTDGNISQKPAAEGTESDIRLMGDELDLDLDLGIEDGDDEIAGAQTIALPDDSDLKLIDPIDDDDSDLPDSGIALSAADDDDDSGISLDIGDSGISLEADDSGISLEGIDSGFAGDSGISLEADASGFAEDSGISLDVGDSGISLDAGDSGISLSADADSGIMLEPEMGHTMAIDKMPGVVGADTGADTMQMDVDEAAMQPAGVATGEFDLGLLDSDEEDDVTDTSVLMFDDDADSDAALDDDDYGTDFDDEGEGDFADDFDDDEMDDVFEAEDDDDDGGSTGMTTAGFAVPSGQMAAAPAEAPWGTAVTAGVMIGSLFSAVAAFAGFELVRTMWGWFQPGAEPSWFLEQIGGFFV